MYRFAVFFVAVIVLGSAIDLWSRQGSSVLAGDQTDGRSTADHAPDCSNLSYAVREAQRTLEHDKGVFATPPNPSFAPEFDAVNSEYAAVQQDLKTLEQAQIQLTQCAPAAPGSDPNRDAVNNCSSEQLLNFQMNHVGEQEREVLIRHLPGSTAFFYEAGMTIDADGAPNAYHPENTGLDDLANAGAPGSWQGLAKDTDGEPFIQGPNDPFPGYYVSATALADRSKPVNDPTRYVDASKIPFIVLPGGMARQIGARPGDFAIVFNQQNGKSSYAIFGDIGPADRIGEGSVALAENLGIRSNARNGGARGGILYLVFPGSGNGQPRTADEINVESEKFLETWGGIPQLTACMVQQSSPPLAGN